MKCLEESNFKNSQQILAILINFLNLSFAISVYPSMGLCCFVPQFCHLLQKMNTLQDWSKVFRLTNAKTLGEHRGIINVSDLRMSVLMSSLSPGNIPTIVEFSLIFAFGKNPSIKYSNMEFVFLKGQNHISYRNLNISRKILPTDKTTLSIGFLMEDSHPCLLVFIFNTSGPQVFIISIQINSHFPLSLQDKTFHFYINLQFDTFSKLYEI